MTTVQKYLKRMYTFVFLLLLTVWFGCGQQPAEQQFRRGEKPDYGGTFRLAQLPPQTLDPLFIDDIYESALVNQLFDGLLKFNVNLRPVPSIAKDWTISPDRLIYTFTMKEGVTFHNGRELTAQDVIYSLKRIFDPAITAPGIAREYLGDISGADEFTSEKEGSIKGLKALSRYTVQLILDRPSHDVLSTLAMDNTKIVPQEEVERDSGYTFARHPIGTGPFQFASWERDQRIVLEANHAYFNGRPYLDSLIFEVPLEYRDEEQVAKFFDGRLETIAVPVGKLQTFTDKERYTIVKRPELSFEFIGFNLQHPPLNILRVRQAISHAIDKKKLTELDPESFLVASGILPPGMPGFSLSPKAHPYNPEKAKRLLSEVSPLGKQYLSGLAYWGVGIDTMKAYENDLIIIENLKQIGIELNVKYESWFEFDQRVSDGKAPLFSMSVIADIPDPASFLFSSFHSQSEMNYFHYHNILVDSLLEKARSELNETERFRLCRQAESMILADAPLVPLDHIINIYAFQPYVQGIELGPFGMADISMEKIWIQQSKQTVDSPSHRPSTTSDHP